VSFSESGPVGADAYFCIRGGYPGISDPNQCVSPRKLGSTTGKGFLGETSRWQLFPASNPLDWPYVGSVFWRYVIEQYSMPTTKFPVVHPSGTDSARPADPNTVLGSRGSDEGIDLYGRVFEGFKAAPTATALQVIDDVLRDNIGRGRDAMVLDMHTALLLKDYSTTDLRWLFQWVGDANAGALKALDPNAGTPANPMSTIKANAGGMLPVPETLTGTGSDFLRRTKRELDDWAACSPSPCTPARLQMGPTDGYASTSDLTIEPFGARYLSFHPGPSIGPVRVRLESLYLTDTRFRIFRVDSSGVPAPLAECDVDPDGAGKDKTTMCPLDPNGVFTMYVGTTGVDEVLIVASAGANGATFRYLIGQLASRIEIVDPLTSRPASVGHASNPRPFLAQIVARDVNNDAIGGLIQSDFDLSLPGCAAADCKLKNGVDYTIANMGGGLYWALVTIPPAFYFPDAQLPKSLDLAVSASTFASFIGSDTESSSVMMSVDLPIVAQFVLDKSGSMNDYGKLDAMKNAASLLVQAMNDQDKVGLVTFNNDAQTVIGDDTAPFLKTNLLGRAAFTSIVNQLTASGWTSIGDGVLEAQSNLILAFGNTVPTPPDRVEHMIVLSDGMNNAGWEPYRYYVAPFKPDTNTDGTSLPPGESDLDPSDNLPWYSGNLTYWERQANNEWLATVSAVALGQDADLVQLQNLADVGGGVFAYSPDDPPPPLPPDLPTYHLLELADAFRSVMNHATGHARVLSVRAATPAPENLPAIPVDSSATELVVSLVSALGDPQELAQGLLLVSPLGQQFTASVSPGARGLVFRVAQPAPGTWTWQWLGLFPPFYTPLPGGQPSTFVEAAQQGGVTLFSRVNPTEERAITQVGAQTENGHWLGMDLLIRAVPFDGVPLENASITADVESPSGVATHLTLQDDGNHADSIAGDGLYAVRYLGGQEPGAYRIRISATGLSAQGYPFTREQWEIVELHGAPDSDGDGVPDWWELENGTDPQTPDSDADPDGDGLSNGDEFLHHTSAQNSDSDGGGESDGSEVAMGQEPRDSSDDGGVTAWPALVACDDSVELSAVLPAGITATIQIENAPTVAGPFTMLPAGTRTQSGSVSVPAENDVAACYRVRTVASGHTSRWSRVMCATPKRDPSPPSLRVDPAAAHAWTRTRNVAVNLVTSDAPSQYAGHRPICSSDVAVTGVTEMLLSTRSDFLGATWQPFSPTFAVTLGTEEYTTVWAKIRDGAGNESPAESLTFRIVLKTPVDHALSLEESALDQLDSGDVASARTSIQESIEQLETSFHSALTRLSKQHDPNAPYVLVALNHIFAQKAKAWALSHGPNHDKARAALAEALELERDLADWADAHAEPL
jgi:von Willebrand factor type A domain